MTSYSMEVAIALAVLLLSAQTAVWWWRVSPKFQNFVRSSLPLNLKTSFNGIPYDPCQMQCSSLNKSFNFTGLLLEDHTLMTGLKLMYIWLMKSADLHGNPCILMKSTDFKIWIRVIPGKSVDFIRICGFQWSPQSSLRLEHQKTTCLER